MPGMPSPPFLLGIELKADQVSDATLYPYSVPCVRGLKLAFRSCVTLLVGENGSGKSTLLEGIAAVCRLPISGGGRNDLAAKHGPRDETPLAGALRPHFRARPRDAYFFRGEYSAHFATLLDQRSNDADFGADAYQRYGGKSLHTRSHGEGYLTVLGARIGHEGLYILDEPEAALSPQRQLTLMALLADRIQGRTQFVIATHSPILMTMPGAEILLIDGPTISPVALEDTEHYQITRGVLQYPDSFWKHLARKV